MKSGEDKAWAILGQLEPDEVKRNAAVLYDKEKGCYILKSLSMRFTVCPADRSISGATPEGEVLTKRLAYFFNHAALWYLAGARDIGLTGRLVRPDDLKDGRQFFKGTHELPLGGLARKYGSDKELFLKRACELGGEVLGLGDASAELLPLPRIPLTLILWLGDEEFPARADVLFDSSAEQQVPIDIIWCTAMFGLLSML
jgi:hypothetical protein